MDGSRVEVFLQGRVQGVGMRYHVRDLAERLGLTGFTRNLGDGRVHIIAEGNREDLEQLLERLRSSQIGHVTGVGATWSRATGEFTDFTIQHAF